MQSESSFQLSTYLDCAYILKDICEHNLSACQYIVITNYRFNMGFNGTCFSTYDRDNDDTTKECARVHGAGWWYTHIKMGNVTTDCTSPFNANIKNPSDEKDNTFYKSRMMIKADK